MICEVFAWLDFVEFVKIVKFVGCSKFILNLIKLNKHLYMTINVIKVFFLINFKITTYITFNKY
jgi:hypothetical protein